MVECDGHATLSSLLQEVVSLESEIVQGVKDSKGRDDACGAVVIDDYRETHPAASLDSVVIQAQSSLAELIQLTGGLINDSSLASLSLEDAMSSLSQAQTLLSLSSPPRNRNS